MTFVGSRESDLMGSRALRPLLKCELTIEELMNEKRMTRDCLYWWKLIVATSPYSPEQKIWRDGLSRRITLSVLQDFDFKCYCAYQVFCIYLWFRVRHFQLEKLIKNVEDDSQATSRLRLSFCPHDDKDGISIEVQKLLNEKIAVRPNSRYESPGWSRRITASLSSEFYLE
jgi:hypothetical protein